MGGIFGKPPNHLNLLSPPKKFSLKKLFTLNAFLLVPNVDSYSLKYFNRAYRLKNLKL